MPAIWVFFRGLKSKSGYFLGFSKKVSDEHTSTLRDRPSLSYQIIAAYVCSVNGLAL